MSALILLKHSDVPGKVPLASDLQLGELAVNDFDGKLFMKKHNGTPSVIEVGATEFLSRLADVSCAAPNAPSDGSLLSFDLSASLWKPTNRPANQLFDGGNF